MLLFLSLFTKSYIFSCLYISVLFMLSSNTITKFEVVGTCPSHGKCLPVSHASFVYSEIANQEVGWI
jgi:hypothetical protein